MRRLIATVLVLSAACAGGGGGGSRTQERETGPIRVGVVGPMTGLASFVGKNMVEGIQLAVDDINADGGLLGRDVDYVTRDDEFDPAKTTTAVRELIESEEVSAIFGPAGTSNYLSMSRIVQEAGVPSWVIIAGADLSDETNPAVFRAFLPDEQQVGPLAAYASKRYKRIAVLSSNDAEGESFRALARTELTKLGRTPVAEEAYAIDETDFSPILLKIKRANPDALIAGTHLGLFAARIATAMRNVGMDAQILGLAGIISYTYPDLAREAAAGTVFVSFRSWVDLPLEQWPASVRTFYERYVERFLKDGEFSQTGAYRAFSTNFLTYDMVQVWAEAVRKAGSADPQDVLDLLNGGFEYPADRSVIGVPWRYTADDHDGIRADMLNFYRWEGLPGGKVKLRILGSTADVLSGTVTP